MKRVIHHRGFHAVASVVLAALTAHAQVPGALSSRADTYAPQEIRVVRSDAQSFIVEYRPVYRAMKSISGSSGEVFQLQDFAGAAGSTSPDDAGSPDLRYRILPLAFPSGDHNTVQILSADYEDIPGVLCAPVPTLKIKDGMFEPAPLTMRQDKYNESRFLPSDVVQISSVQQSRGVMVGAVRIYPVQFNAASRTLRRYSRLLIQVTFGPVAGRVPRNRRDDRLYNPVLLNWPAAAAWPAAPAAVARRAATNSVLASGVWYKIPVTNDGLYVLDATFFSQAGINIAQIDPRTIRIFGNGGRELSETATDPRPSDLLENAVYVSTRVDSAFGPGDFVLFYGRSPRGWTYAPTTKTFAHYINHYTETNYYWLTYGGAFGKRMQVQPSLATAPAFVPDRFTDHLFVEDERVNILDPGSGKDWLGQSISPGGSFTYVNSLTNLVPNDFIRYRYMLVSELGTSASMSVSEGKNPLGSYFLGTANGNYQVATSRAFAASGTSSLSSNQSQLSFTYSTFGQSGTGWIDWIEIVYPRALTGVQGGLRFRSADTSAVVEYQLQQFSSAPMVFDVTSPQDVRIITGVSPAALQGMYYFRAQENAGSISEYDAVVQGGWQRAAAPERVNNQNLHGYADSTDFIIITSPEFRAAADRLAAWRRQPAHGGLRTFVVDVAQIYNEFGGGLPDAVAMRDFLMYTYSNWPVAPQFVLFFGGASYDYKGILGYASSYVPTWQSPESYNSVDSYSTDDFFVSQYPNFTPYFITGRIACRTPGEADIIEGKIERYDVSSGRDPWKMRMIFVGDDAWTSDQVSAIGDMTEHSDQEEELAGPIFSPDELEKEKIYIAGYPTVWAAEGRRKPGAYQAIIDDINRGALLLNYAGHGNPTVWAHERIFQVETSIPQLVNADRLPIYILATCNFSEFDDAKNYTGGELLMNKPDGGGIGLVSATRKVYSTFNKILNDSFTKHLFTRDTFGRVVVERPATALFLAKVGGLVDENSQKFFYMGDPTMRLQYPGGHAVIDSINAQPVDSIGGVPRTTAIPLQSLSKVTVVGSMRRDDNSADTTYSGRAKIVVNDATTVATILDFYPGAPPWNYVLTGGSVYQGENSIVGGKFRATFIVPKDIAFADTAAHGRMVAYCYNPNLSGSANDGVAYTSSIRIAAPDTTAIPPGSGPSISIFFDNRNFRAGDLVSENPLLLVDLADSVGINTSTTGIGHRIEAWVNNSPTSIDVTNFYTSKPDDFRQGTVQYQLKDLPDGRSTVRVRAWDSYNNSATAESFFTVASSERLTITDVMNYPNPFSGSTFFTMHQNQTAPVQITIKIYTLAGRMIQSVDALTGEGESFVRIPWDGRDRDGDNLANGVYLYKVTARTLDGRFSTEALGKLSVLR